MTDSPDSRGPRRVHVLLGVIALVLTLALPLAWINASGEAESVASSSGPVDEPAETVTPSPPRKLQAAPMAPCPATFAQPDPDRPEVSLRFDVAADHRTVAGRETVTFSPDRRIEMLVFRLWPNAEVSASRGASLDVSEVRVDGEPLTLRTKRVGAAAGTQGTVLEVDLPAAVPAGTPVTAELDFVLSLPPAGRDRYGSWAHGAWWGTGHPMLAWVDGQGWQRDPPPRFLGEGAVSEAADTEILVVAPADDVVLTVGPVSEVATPPGAAPGSRAWRASNAVARDVSVTVSQVAASGSVGVDVPEIHAIAGGAEPASVDLQVAVARGVYGDPETAAEANQLVLDLTADSVRRLSEHLGGFPYPSLSVTVLPNIGAAGIEYPGAFLLGSREWGQVVPHEVAHMWFYGMVGNNQSADPWLDEAYATYLESLYSESALPLLAVTSVPDPVGWSVSDFDGLFPYGNAVYLRGGGALLSARGEVGRQAFDDATRCFVRTTAWQVSSPDQVHRAYAHLPGALEILTEVGAFVGHEH